MTKCNNDEQPGLSLLPIRQRSVPGLPWQWGNVTRSLVMFDGSASACLDLGAEELLMTVKYK
jgi:hypothetical protein